ncbi:MAG: bifunctional hydroxymethylpyrimidine kinase/phosphomethylpyrimidine kinase [Leptolyngbya sp.]|nr:bifunctional hydroxymethylpyrimidine kinase/phosphomethylpyrimidine kinase [Leptolyngbya sp.]
MTIPVALTIAGSDSGGGAGIQADLRTFSFHQVHGTSAITCVTAQNTLGVNRVDVLDPEAVTAQIEAVVGDIGVQAAKTGMLPNAAIIAAVAQCLQSLGITNLVVDPVMVSRSGAPLIEDEAIATLIQTLIPLATVLTPNRYEAQILSGLKINTLDDMKQAAGRILQLGPETVVVKGGGMRGEWRGVDVCGDRHGITVIKTETVDTPDTHGTGCTLSAAIAANLALGYTANEAIHQGKQYVTTALHHSLRIGAGQGPVGHFFPLIQP